MARSVKLARDQQWSGNGHKVYGNDCIVKGNRNTVYGNRCLVIGNDNKIMEPDCIADGERNICKQGSLNPTLMFGSSSFLNTAGVQGIVQGRGVASWDAVRRKPKAPRGTRAANMRPADDVHTDNENEQCSVCLDNKKVCVVLDCGHKCLCITCAKALQTNRCPICNEDIREIKRVYE